ncbi:hypothetical protein H2198_002577 [Neophaeococcomyces mojaviensis]|uniref:Uncharacterized protein n=1 Tax=Neophaeococcomyces mojaviensis TaxID=3383035 RepID=A0ACC3AED6_9EURO|nr:hypothetical protein H2198_002577 [Knufia sp. JES_112]
MPLVKRRPVASTLHASPSNRLSFSGRSTEPLQDESSRARDSERSRHHIRHRSGKHKHTTNGSTYSDSSRSSGTDLSLRRYLPKLWAWIDHVPQSADDQYIIASVRRIFATAEQYVNNFYVDRLGQRTELEPFIERHAFSDIPEGCSKKDLLSSVVHPTTVIKHSLVVTLLSTISLECPDHLPPLLPKEYLSLARAIRQSKSSANDGDIPHFHAAFSAYRILTHYIRGNVVADASYIKQRSENIREIIDDIEAVFQPWVNENRTPDQRGPVLAGLLQQSAELGILLFCQPSTFHFDWQVLPTRSRDLEVAITPRLLKLFDENAQEIEEPQQMIRVRMEKTKLRVQPQTNHKLGYAIQGRQHMKNRELEQLVKDQPHSYAVELPAEGPTFTEEIAGQLQQYYEHDPVQDSTTAHEVSGETIDSRARTLGPPLDEPDFDHSNGEGYRFAEDKPSHSPLVQTNIPRLTSGSTIASRAITGECSVSAITTKQQMYNEYAAAAIHNEHFPLVANNEQERGVTNEYVVFPRTANLLNSQPPPSSYRGNIGHGSLARSGSLDRGRGSHTNQHQRNRSRSEARAPITGRSSTWSPDEVDGKELEISHRDSANHTQLAERYIEKMQANGRARDQRNVSMSALQPTPDGHPGRAIVIINDDVEQGQRNRQQHGEQIEMPSFDARPSTSTGNCLNDARALGNARSSSQIERSAQSGQLRETLRTPQKPSSSMFKNVGKTITGLVGRGKQQNVFVKS